MKRVLLPLALFLMLTSCSTMNFISIQVLRPAQLPLPADAKRVAIVNNAVSQPNDYGVVVYNYGTKLKVKSIAHDSLSVYYAQELLNRLNSTKGREFKWIDFNAKKRKNYTEDSPLSRYTLQTVVDSTNADCIIALDRLLINSVMRLEYYYSSFRLTMDSQIKPTVRIYSADNLLKPRVVRQQDSLYWETIQASATAAAAAFPPMSLCYKDIMAYNVNKIVGLFFPSSESVSRYYYYGNDINLKEAARYASLNRWDDACEIWNYVYSVEKSPKKKAYCAANIALYNELNDNFEKAIEWAQIAEKHFQSKNKAAMKYEAERTANYIRELTIRKEDAKQLDNQLIGK